MAPRKKIGLALGSGAARGWAHIGVIDALVEKGVPIDIVAGSSIGALVGAAYAGGKLDQLRDFVTDLDWRTLVNFFDPVLPRSGILDGKRIADFIGQHTENENIEDLKIPFAAVSTDLMTGEEEVIDRGSVIDAVRASISIPGMFTPLKKGDCLLVDGGLVNPLPVSVARSMGADFVIAVDINYGVQAMGIRRPARAMSRKAARKAVTNVRQQSEDHSDENSVEKKWKGGLMELGKKFAILEYATRNQIEEWMLRDPVPGIFEILLASYNILEVQVTEARLKTDPPDILFRPEVAHFEMIDFDLASDTIGQGYKAVMEYTGEFPVG